MRKRRFKVLPLILIISIVLSYTSLYVGASAGISYESESNNTYSTADVTYNDYDNYGIISSSSDVDWWKVTFSQSGYVNFWLGNVATSCDYDMYIYV